LAFCLAGDLAGAGLGTSAGFEEDSGCGSCACTWDAANSRKTAVRIGIILLRLMPFKEVSLYSDSV
jgi:hypothetical protein